MIDFRPAGKYSKPKTIDLGCVPAIVVDPHSEIVSYAYENYRARGKPSFCLEVDHHPDMQDGAPNLFFEDNTWKIRKCGEANSIKKYEIAKIVGIGAYNSLLFSLGVWKHLCHMDPIDNLLGIYEVREGSGTQDTLQTVRKTTSDGLERVAWARPIYPRKLTISGLVNEIEGKNRDFAVNIDLDGFYCLDTYSKSEGGYEEFMTELEYLPRIAQVKETLKLCPIPKQIFIARSQTPVTFVPPKDVDDIQLATIEALEEIYR